MQLQQVIQLREMHDIVHKVPYEFVQAKIATLPAVLKQSTRVEASEDTLAELEAGRIRKASAILYDAGHLLREMTCLCYKLCLASPSVCRMLPMLLTVRPGLTVLICRV